MTTAAVTFPTLGDNPPDSSDCNQNFTDLVSYLNTNSIDSDGSLAWTSLQEVADAPETSNPPPPVSDNQAVHMKYSIESVRLKVYTNKFYGNSTAAWHSHTLGINGVANTTTARVNLFGAAGPEHFVTIPSWATTAMITTTFHIAGDGVSAPTWRYGLWFNANQSGTPITNLGSLNFELKGPWTMTPAFFGLGEGQINVQKTLWTVDAAVKGATQSIGMWSRLTSGGTADSVFTSSRFALEMEFYS